MNRWEICRHPFISTFIRVFCVNAIRIVNHPGFDLFELVGLFADKFETFYANMTPLQQPYRLLPARLAVSVCAFCFRMIFVFAQHVAISLHERGTAAMGSAGAY